MLWGFYYLFNSLRFMDIEMANYNLIQISFPKTNN
jgi:hypothetical protein